MEQVKMFLFARWLATSYEGVLNTVDGEWYKTRLEYFETIIWVEYLKVGTAQQTLEFLNTKP